MTKPNWRLLRSLIDKKWRPSTTPYKFGHNERVIEIPWALSQYKGEEKVLEVGPVGAQTEYLEALRNLHIPELHGLDITEEPLSGFKMSYADVRKAPFVDNYFDMIYCISTLEHVGKDNGIYKPTQEINSQSKKQDVEYPTFSRDFTNDEDIVALKELERILKPQGKLLLTMPYGKFQDHGWFTHYDAQHLDRLLNATSLKILEDRYFHYFTDGWRECVKSDLVNATYYGNGAPNASGVVCLVLTK